jgi:hypothetical protein
MCVIKILYMRLLPLAALGRDREQLVYQQYIEKELGVFVMFKKHLPLIWQRMKKCKTLKK